LGFFLRYEDKLVAILVLWGISLILLIVQFFLTIFLKRKGTDEISYVDWANIKRLIAMAMTLFYLGCLFLILIMIKDLFFC
jgi:cytochrome c-type biogenesis protein CcmH/NrfF